MTQPPEKPPSYLNPEQTGPSDEPSVPLAPLQAVRLCRRCEQPVPDGSRFCNHCGAGIAPTCPSCRTENDTGNQYCVRCGTSLTQPATEAVARIPAQEQGPVATGPAQPAPLAADQLPNEAPPATPAAEMPTEAVPVAPSALESLTCPRCRKLNESAARYCYACGLPLDDVERGLSSGTVGPAEMEPTRTADSGARIIAFVFDSFLVLVGVFIVLVIRAASDPVFAESLDSDDSAFMNTAYLAFFAIFTVYHAGAIAIWGQTLGKRFAKIKVVDSDGRKPSFNRSFGRCVSSYASSFFYVGYLIGLMRSDRRALHDLLAGTWVVRKPG